MSHSKENGEKLIWGSHEKDLKRSKLKGQGAKVQIAHGLVISPLSAADWLLLVVGRARKHWTTVISMATHGYLLCSRVPLLWTMCFVI